jgi:WD domain, G-beta repeat
MYNAGGCCASYLGTRAACVRWTFAGIESSVEAMMVLAGYVAQPYLPHILAGVFLVALMSGQLWDVDTGECLQVFRGHFNQIYAVAFDGKIIASGGLDTTVRVWDALTGYANRKDFALTWSLTRGLHFQKMHCNATGPYCTGVLLTIDAAITCDGRGRRAGASVRAARLTRTHADRSTRFVGYIAAV